MMTNINIFCQLGISSNLFAKKIEERIKIKELDWTIEAHNIQLINDLYSQSDLVLISPAVTMLPAFKKNIEKLRSEYPKVKLLVINSEIYFNLDIERMLKEMMSSLS